MDQSKPPTSKQTPFQPTVKSFWKKILWQNSKILKFHGLPLRDNPIYDKIPWSKIQPQPTRQMAQCFLNDISATQHTF